VKRLAELREPVQGCLEIAEPLERCELQTLAKQSAIDTALQRFDDRVRKQRGKRRRRHAIESSTRYRSRCVDDAYRIPPMNFRHWQWPQPTGCCDLRRRWRGASSQCIDRAG
jgi:hypothetical protein